MAERDSAARLLVVGADHKSSTMTARDRLFLRQAALPAFYDRLRGAGFVEATVISTNDRTDIVAVDPGILGAVDEIRRLLAAQAGLTRGEIESQTYALQGRDAIKHVFAICSALDGLVAGDARLRDIVRQASVDAERRGAAGEVLAALFERGFSLAEEIERETDLAHRPSSIPAALAYVARDLHGDLSRCRALLIGTGEMGELLAAALSAVGLSRLVVTHPTPARAEAVAQTLNCHAGDFSELVKLLAAADIVLTSMNTRRFVLDRELVRGAVAARRRKPIFVVDTGVPGDVDPAVADVEDAFLYTLDDLERVTREAAHGRQKALARAWELVEAAVADYIGVAEQSQPADEPDSMETLRRESVRLADGDADKATRILVERLLKRRRDR